MVRSKYSYEKNMKEKAKRKKQQEKSAQRMTVKKATPESEMESLDTDAVADDQEALAK